MLGEDGDDLVLGLHVGVGEALRLEVRVAADEVGHRVLEPADELAQGRVVERGLEVLDDLGVDAGQVGQANSWTEVLETTKRPPREQGEIVKDEGDGGTKLAEFLAAQKFI